MNKGRPFNKWCYNTHKTKQQLWLMPHTISKINSKWIINLNIKSKTRFPLWLCDKKKKKKKIHLPMKEKWVRFLVQEDPTCCRATGPCPTTTDPRAWGPHLLKPASPAPTLSNERAAHLDQRAAPTRRNQRKAHIATKSQHSPKQTQK